MRESKFYQRQVEKIARENTIENTLASRSIPRGGSDCHNTRASQHKRSEETEAATFCRREGAKY